MLHLNKTVAKSVCTLARPDISMHFIIVHKWPFTNNKNSKVMPNNSVEFSVNMHYLILIMMSLQFQKKIF